MKQKVNDLVEMSAGRGCILGCFHVQLTAAEGNLSMAMAPHAPVDPGCYFHSHKRLNEVFKFFMLLDWHSWAREIYY